MRDIKPDSKKKKKKRGERRRRKVDSALTAEHVAVPKRKHATDDEESGKRA